MTALIADTSPLLRKIPSDPAVDRRTFGFSPSQMSFARYVAEGRPAELQQSPNVRGYSTHQTPGSYSRGYSYSVAESFPCEDPGAPARIPHRQCGCQRPQQQCDCFCSPDGSNRKQQQRQARPDAPCSMWHNKGANSSCNSNKKNGTSNNPADTRAAVRPGLFSEAASRPRSTATPPPMMPAPTGVATAASSSSTSSAARERRVDPVPARKQTDWENLLGAVDLELRSQQRSEYVPEPTVATAVPQLSPHNGPHRAPLHPSAGDNRYTSGVNAPAAASPSASVSPELSPYKPTHRRGGVVGGVSGGGPAYSGSTADAASLLATLPQRMLDRVSMSAHKTAAVGVSAPAIVSDGAGHAAPQPIRVQASGRRGPRGQSRFKGVCITRAGKWRAVIYIGRKQKYLGVFDSEFDAARAYDASALQHFAEGAKLNFPDGIEQQLNDISGNGVCKTFETTGGSAAERSATPPAIDAAGGGSSAARKRQRKSAFGDDDDEWVRDVVPWGGSRR